MPKQLMPLLGSKPLYPALKTDYIIHKWWFHVSTAHPGKDEFFSNAPFHFTLVAAAAQLQFFHSELGPNYWTVCEQLPLKC